MDNKTRIENWIKTLSGNEALFISIRFKTPPKTKSVLCKRCKPVFSLLFRELLGRHWHKTYHKNFTLIGFKEVGSGLNMHAHFILGVQENKYTAPNIIQTLKSLSGRIKMDVWDSEEDKAANPKQFGDDTLIEPIYSSGAFAYITKEMQIRGNKITGDNIILDIDLIL